MIHIELNIEMPYEKPIHYEQGMNFKNWTSDFKFAKSDLGDKLLIEYKKAYDIFINLNKDIVKKNNLEILGNVKLKKDSYLLVFKSKKDEFIGSARVNVKWKREIKVGTIVYPKKHIGNKDDNGFRVVSICNAPSTKNKDGKIEGYVLESLATKRKYILNEKFLEASL